MKKSLVMAMAMAMGVTASAYAANPFSDVPAGHWAYDAVAQLAAAGVVDGYGTTFGGEKLMTRYEMAQIVAKAMAKGGNCDKLAAEFADELDALGVRVAKLEKKVDNVKITGQIRYAYADVRGDEDQYANGSSLRTRIFVEGNINDDWTYTGMLQNQRAISPTSTEGDGDAISLKRAYLDGRVGGVKVRAGKWNEFFINDTILDEMIDGVQASYQFGKVNVFGVASKFSGSNAGSWRAKYYDSDTKKYGGYDDSDRLYILGAETKFGATKVALNYFKVHGNHVYNTGDTCCAPFDFNQSREIYSLNVDFPFAKDFNATVRYSFAGKKLELRDGTTPDAGKHGWLAQVNYRAADPAKQGTWGVRARYFNQPRNVWLSPTYDCEVFDGDKDAFGYKGWNLGADWTMAKNIMLQVDYYDTRSIAINNADTKKARTIFSQLYFFF